MPLVHLLRCMTAGLLACSSVFAAETRYVMRADPLLVMQEGKAASTMVGQLTLNQAVTLERSLGGGNCRLGTPIAGAVPCAALSTTPASLESTEQALKRLVLLYRHPEAARDKSPAPASRSQLLTDILGQLELRFALSPSIYTLVYYTHWLETRRQETSSPQAASRHPVVERMKAALSQDFAARPPLPPVPASPWLDPLGDPYQLLKPHARTQRSFFRNAQELVGWAGGGLVQRMRLQGASGISYSANFDGSSIITLAQLYELAKQMRRKVNVRVGPFEDPDGLSMAQTLYGVGRGTVSTDLPAYAITDQGVVEGRFLTMTYDGGACASEGHRTSAEFRFASPLRGTIYGIFASKRPVDIARARVKNRQREWLEFSPDTARPNAWTESRFFSADLNGDGIADLKGGHQSQMEAPESAATTHGPKLMPVHFRPVAGWYAHEPLWLMGNIAGLWQEIARYDVVTCT